jgi:heterodisulfide reductase subunit A-like polyferredoxin
MIYQCVTCGHTSRDIYVTARHVEEHNRMAPLATSRVEEIGIAAQELSDYAVELIELREDKEASREDRESATEEFESAIRVLVAVLPKKERPVE